MKTNNNLQKETSCSRNLAKKLLSRLRYQSEEHLLELSKEERYDALATLQTLALEHLPPSVEETGEIPEDPALLVEESLEREELHAEAAALYALFHDDLFPRREVSAGWDFILATLRLKLAHCLSYLDESQETVKTQVHLLRSAVAMCDRAVSSGSIDQKEERFLQHHLGEALGRCHRALGELEKAQQAYETAANYAPNTDLRVASSCMAASCLIDLGERQAAYRRLFEEQPHLAEVSDPETIEHWEVLHTQLRSQLGGREAWPDRGRSADSARLISGIYARWLRAEKIPELDELDELRQLFLANREGLEPDDALGHFQQILGALEPTLACGQHEDWKALMAEAEVLEDRFTEPVPKLERRLLLARQEMYFGDPAAAVRDFDMLWHEMTVLLPLDRLLAAAGFYLEALGKEGSLELRKIRQLVGFVVQTLEDLLARQPSAAARARVREEHQRPIETALLVLLSTAEQMGMQRDQGQELLARAWSVIVAGRNPELRMQEASCPAEQSKQHQVLEDALHLEMRKCHVVEERDVGWRAEMEALLDFEMAWAESPAQPGMIDGRPPKTGVALAFFQFRELLEDRPLLLLMHHLGHFSVRIVSNIQEHELLSLQSWADALSPSSKTPPSEEDVEAARKAAAELFGVLPRDVAPDSLLLLPDGGFYDLPLEILPDPYQHEASLGQSWGVHLGLRPLPADAGEVVDLGGGWLGLGDVPAAGRFTALPASGEEIQEIARILAGAGFPADVLLGKEARSSRLRELVTALRPAVVHIAAHGFTDSRDPEACFLVLAPDPNTPEGELLPHRRLRRLDLEKTQLVVLSGCATLLGRLGRGTGMEGLAWAVLAAGARQVLASRYPVSDEITAEFMLELYRQLPEHAPAEALRRVRVACLKRGMASYEVGAWGLWG